MCTHPLDGHSRPKMQAVGPTASAFGKKSINAISSNKQNIAFYGPQCAIQFSLVHSDGTENYGKEEILWSPDIGVGLQYLQRRLHK